MGFISSGSTVITTAYLTQRGRELLIKGNKSDFKIKYFALGDSDTNYNIENPAYEGTIPDLTGDNQDCLKSISENVDIKHKVNLD